MQFSLHYFCNSRDRCEQLVRHISRALRPGGLWIGSTVREASLGLSADAPPFGASYSFALEGVIDREVEYRVPYHALRDICKACGLELCFWRTLHCWLRGAHLPSTQDANHAYVVYAFINVGKRPTPA
jgi:hypothetical protein